MKLTRLRQYIKRNPLTIVIGAILVIFLSRTTFFQKPPKPTPTVLPKVTVMDMTAIAVTTNIQLNGHTAEARHVTLKAKNCARIQSLLVKKGQKIDTGQDLIQFDPEDLPAQLAEAKAKHNQRSLELQANMKLEAKAVKSQNALAASSAEYEAAKSALAGIEQKVIETHVKAPFNGILEDNFVEVGDVVCVGDQLATVLELNPLKIVCDVSEKDISRIRIGGESEVTLPSFEDKKLSAQIIYIAKAANPKTRTYRIEMLADNPDMMISAGLTARIVFPTNKTIGYTISPAYISLRDDGTVGVKIVAEKKVVFYPVQIVEAKPKGLLITGLPDHVALITTGGDFVIEGQEVNAIREVIGTPEKSS